MQTGNICIGRPPIRPASHSRFKHTPGLGHIYRLVWYKHLARDLSIVPDLGVGTFGGRLGPRECHGPYISKAVLEVIISSFDVCNLFFEQLVFREHDGKGTEGMGEGKERP